MKNTLNILAGILLFLTFACQNNINDGFDNEDDPSPIEINIDGTYLSLDHIQDFIPDEIFERKSIVYQSLDGKEIILKSDWSEIIGNGTHGGEQPQQYEYENLIIALTDEKGFLSINLYGRAFYQHFSENGTPIQPIKHESFSMDLMPSFPDVNTSGTIELDLEGNLISATSHESPMPTPLEPMTITLNDITFEDAFHFRGDDPDRFSEFFYRPDIGVFGFRTFNNTLYVFKEFVD